MKPLLFAIAFFCIFQADAAASAIYSYEYYWPQELAEYFQKINTAARRAPPAEAGRCGVYRRALDRGQMDVRYALGYFDDSQGHEITHDNHNYGLSPSLDIAVFNVIRRFMTAACAEGSPQRLCGFIEEGSPDDGQVVLSKPVMLDGREVQFRVTLTQASASELYADNKGPLASRQDAMSRQSEENYFGGIGEADVVFYNGHSRNGGGPDFSPPVLNRARKTDYEGYYEVRRDGIRHVLEAVRAGRNRDQVLGFFSCFSRRHFRAAIERANPGQPVIFSADDIDYKDSLLASMGYLEGLMQGRCGQDLADLAKQGAKIQNGFQGYNIR